MKAKLIKTGSDYLLRDMGGNVLAITNGTTEGRKLSKQNCDEIFGVVDVGKLALEECNNTDPLRLDSQKYKQDPYFRIGYLKGYNKAMELNDKLFTVKDMKAIFAFGHVVGMNNILAIQSQHSPQPLPKPDSDKLRDEVIQSLQQPTEIEVDIRCYIGNGDKESDSFKEPLVTNTGIPKLDENGCLILKKK
jgi:hypothetical protein